MNIIVYILLACSLLLGGGDVYYYFKVNSLESDNKTLEASNTNLVGSIQTFSSSFDKQNAAFKLLQKTSDAASLKAKNALAIATKATNKERLDARELMKQKSNGNLLDDCKSFELNLNRELNDL